MTEGGRLPLQLCQYVEEDRTRGRHTANLREQRLHIVVLERQPTAEHHVQNDTAAPYINLWASIQSTADDFRCSIVGTTAARLEEVAVLDLVRETEVGNLDVQVVVKQHILWLQVSVDDLQMMTILNSRDELLEEPTCLRLGHPPVRNDIVEQLSTGVFKNNDDVGGCGYHLVPIP